MENLVLRVDAGADIGMGHLMRSLTLGAAWKAAQGGVVCATASRDAWIDGLLTKTGFRRAAVRAAPGSADDAQETLAVGRAVNAEWIVIDGYHFTAGYQRALAAGPPRVLCIDDNGEAGEYVADVVLNQNPHASERLYARRAEQTRLLLGPDYVLLRAEFTKEPRTTRAAGGRARKILVTLGGGASDAAVMVALGIVAASRVDGLEALVIAGAASDRAALERASADVAGSVRLTGPVDNMPELMRWADIAIAAAGSTCWELAFSGVPTLAMAVADNQLQALKAFAASGAALTLGWWRDVHVEAAGRRLRTLAESPEALERMSAAGHRLVDGRGAERVVAAMRASTSMETRVPGTARGGRQ